MTVDRATVWEGLLRHAYDILDAASELVDPIPSTDWTVGGGTMLMRRYRHRVSKDVDIFLGDAQRLGSLSPRLNAVAEGKTSEYVEQSGFVKLYFGVGEIDFIVAPPLTHHSATTEDVLGRTIRVESDAEIIAKKLEYRGSQLKARDVFDFGCVIDKNPIGLDAARPIIKRAGNVLFTQLDARGEALEEDFQAIDTLDYAPSYGECVVLIRDFLARL